MGRKSEVKDEPLITHCNAEKETGLMGGKPIGNKERANLAVKRIRLLRRRIADAEMAAEGKIGTIKEQLVLKTAGDRLEEGDLRDSLQDYYNANKPPKSNFIDLQHGRIGVRRCPRVDCPKSAIKDLPPRALSVHKRINKRALAKLGEKVMLSVGAKVVRPLKFYVSTKDEDAKL